MKVAFETPGCIRYHDAIEFANRVKNEYGINITFTSITADNCIILIKGMTAEGDDTAMTDFMAKNLGHVNWLRIS